MTLSEATRQYQAVLEAARVWPHDDDLVEQVSRARAHVETLWLEEHAR